jgi:hypothetical protein
LAVLLVAKFNLPERLSYAQKGCLAFKAAAQKLATNELVRYPIRREIKTEGLNMAEANVAMEQTTLTAMCKSHYI